MSQLVKLFLTSEVVVDAEGEAVNLYAAALGGTGIKTDANGNITSYCYWSEPTTYTTLIYDPDTGGYVAVVTSTEPTQVCSDEATDDYVSGTKVLTDSSTGGSTTTGSASLVAYSLDGTQEVADTFTQSVSDPNIGWNAGAVSVGTLTGDGQLTVVVDVNAVGVIVGLSEPGDSVGVGYNEIRWAFHCERGEYRIVERGTPVTAFTAYTSGDELAVVREGSAVRYYVADVLVYTSTATTSADYLFVDTSMYMGGDTITSAALSSAVDVYGGTLAGSTTLTAKAVAKTTGVLAGSTTAVGYPDSIVGGVTQRTGRGTIAGSTTITGTPRGAYYGTVAASLPSLSGLASDEPYAEVDATLTAMTASAGGGFFLPDIAWVAANLPRMTLNTEGITGEVGEVGETAAAPLPALDGLTSDFEYGEVVGTLPTMTAASYPFFESDSYALLKAPAFTVQGTGNQYLSQGVIEAPLITMEGHFGSSAEVLMPEFEVSATGTSINIGRARLEMPEFTVAGTGLRGTVADGAMVYQASFTITGHFGGAADLEMPSFGTSAAAKSGAVGTARLEMPEITLSATGSSGTVGRASLEMPAFVSLHGSATLEMPAFTMQAEATGVSVTSYFSAYSVNLSNNALTEYYGPQFRQVIAFKGRYFAFTNNALYEITGTTDDGTAIDVSAKISAMDAGTSRHKRVPNMYVGADSTDAIAGQIYFDGSFVGHFASQRSLAAGNRQVKLPRGARGRWFSPVLTNVDGGNLDVYEVEYTPMVLRGSR